jgi:uncharacterized RDD family membrane protein YckC
MMAVGRPDAARGPASVDDPYDLRTPEQIELQYDLAGLGSRFLAMMIDGLIQTVVLLALAAVFGLGAALLYGGLREVVSRSPSVVLSVGIGLGVLLSFAIGWGYFIFFEMVWNGQTPGKRYIGIRVLTARGEPVTLVHSLVRNVMRLVDALPSGYMLGSVCILVTRRSQRLGDLAAGTVVVRERHVELPHALPPIHPSLELPAHLAGAFSSADILLARDFVRRSPYLAQERRSELRGQIARTLRARIAASGQPLPPDLTDERLVMGAAHLRA